MVKKSSFLRFDTIPECDGRTDRQTDGQTDIPPLAIPAVNALVKINTNTDSVNIEFQLCYNTNIRILCYSPFFPRMCSG